MFAVSGGFFDDSDLWGNGPWPCYLKAGVLMFTAGVFMFTAPKAGRFGVIEQLWVIKQMWVLLRYNLAAGRGGALI
jgi:hypothetical protein